MKTIVLFTLGFLGALSSGCVAEGGGSKEPTDSVIISDAAGDALALTDSVQAFDTSSQDIGTTTDTSGAPEVTLPQDAGKPEDVTDSKQVLPPGLKGIVPPGDTALPQFSAVVDQDGNSVGPDRLVGSWSVLWFYPIASTAG